MVEWWGWMAAIGLILVMLALDLLVVHRDAHEVSTREAATWSAVWITLAMGFGGAVWAWLGREAAGAYLAGYLTEKLLSVDNIFVLALLLSYFAVPPRLQHRLLFWGVLGALVFRGVFIGAGAALLHAAHWTTYVFGAFLIVTSLKLLRHGDSEVHPDRNPVLRVLRGVVPLTTDYHGQRFVVRDAGRRLATPLLAVLIVVETTDIVFAVDSIPAIFALTDDPFLVFTSNAFALLGMRALYFLLADMIGRFTYLKIGLAAVLALAGVKMLAADLYDVPVWASLGAIALILASSVVASLRTRPAPDDGQTDEALDVLA
ncbi:MAG TPA: TerC family protein, partial [Acidimicrobiales bacterium]|nr:TerC family protein [Acidimicrobiales bacterium]